MARLGTALSVLACDVPAVPPTHKKRSMRVSFLTIVATTALGCHLFLSQHAGYSFLPFAPVHSATAMSPSSSPRFRTWPITATRSIEPLLQSMGLRVPAWRIDGTSSRGCPSSSSVDDDDVGTTRTTTTCFSDALVSVGPAGRGGTGSFVSSDGLIMTNWHVAYDAVRRASLRSEKDYVKEGFVARHRSEEVHGPDYEVWIAKSCRDVSEEVLSVISGETDPLLRANRARDVVQDIASRAQEDVGGSAGGGIRCDVQEMLPNESYVLFVHERLRDVRIAYVPPKSLGNFGGDVDNFEWPRHTADFALLRAYVGPDGSAAEHSPDNVPYSSNSRLRVQEKGAGEGDFVFLLGFPGRTMRYAPTSRLQYSDDVAVPNMVTDFERKLGLIAEHPEASLKLGTAKKSLSNELKRSRGKLLMMRKLGLLEERKKEEEELCEKAPEARRALDRLEEIYRDFATHDKTSAALRACRGVHHGSSLLAAGHSLHEYLFVERDKPDGGREAAYRERNLPFLFARLGKRLADVHVPHEAALIDDALGKLSGTTELDKLRGRMTKILGDDAAGAVSASILREMDGDSIQKMMDGGGEKGDLLKNDPFVQCAEVLWETYRSERDRSKALLSERDALFAELLDLHRKHSEEVIYPDCNGSLRISAGHVEGYRAADAIDHRPSTTLSGLFDKAVEARLTSANSDLGGRFECPQRLYQMLDGGIDPEKIGKVPVCLLYSTDTVGGNSGSPVLNADGEFVAINFDRQRQGLMNEFKWSKDYSRSIGVDIRYILWLVGEYDGVSHLVREILSTQEEC